jgi:hypothetical protein
MIPTESHRQLPPQRSAWRSILDVFGSLFAGGAGAVTGWYTGYVLATGFYHYHATPVQLAYWTSAGAVLALVGAVVFCWIVDIRRGP